MLCNKYKISCTGYQLLNAVYQIPNTRFQIENAGHQIQDTIYWRLVSGYLWPNTRCWTQSPTGHKIPYTGYQFLVTSILIIALPKLTRLHSDLFPYPIQKITGDKHLTSQIQIMFKSHCIKINEKLVIYLSSNTSYAPDYCATVCTNSHEHMYIRYPNIST